MNIIVIFLNWLFRVMIIFDNINLIFYHDLSFFFNFASRSHFKFIYNISFLQMKRFLFLLIEMQRIFLILRKLKKIRSFWVEIMYILRIFLLLNEINLVLNSLWYMLINSSSLEIWKWVISFSIFLENDELINRTWIFESELFVSYQ